MQIAVTGGNGFLGRAVIKAATEAGHEAWSFDRATGHDVLCKLNGLDGADAVIHLAGVSGTHELFDDPEIAIEINTIGSLRVQQWCTEADAKYVGILAPDTFPSIYNATKIAAYRLAVALAHSRKLRMNHVRLWNVYGPGQEYGIGHPQRLIPTFATKAWRGEPLPVWGDGSQWVDLIHVDVAAKIILAAATMIGCERIIDAGTNSKLSVMEVAQRTITHTKSRGGILLLPMRDGEICTRECANGDGWSFLESEDRPWKPQYDWASLLETIDSYRQDLPVLTDLF